MNVSRINEPISTDPMFTNWKSIYHGFTAAQVFYGTKSHTIFVYGIKNKGEFPKVYKEFIKEQGAPSALRRDNAKEEQSEEVKSINREFLIKDKPKTRGELCTLTCYVDADHARDMVTRRSVTGILVLLNNTPISWYSKRQKTVESSTYGLELVASRIAVEKVIALRYFISKLGCNLEPSSLLLGDNMAVVLNTTIPSSTLKKKHQACNYHKVRESIAGGFIKYGHIKSDDNMADILTKPLPRIKFERLTAQYLFRRPKTVTVNQTVHFNMVYHQPEPRGEQESFKERE